ncbi:endonuclease/exonuclease/phosphatase family protein [Pseudochrobactrum sp. MP213Fo]|uniref:endonuclease/exonuclease/phosphatase family protein n=1 Tax=Pseudochrobactrum sp. MP213Fo TaxID=3022250 RepID=UPI003BA2C725
MSDKIPAPAVKPASIPAFALLIVLVLLSVPLVIGFFGRLHPAFDSFAHFRAHIAAVMAAGGIVLLFTSLRREAAMITLLGLSAFSTTINWSGNAQPAEPASGLASGLTSGESNVTYRLMQINLQQDNPDPKGVLQAIARQKPDIITYQEGSELWQPWLKVLEGNYPYHQQCSNLPSKWGVGILSRRPFAEFGAPVCTGEGLLATALVNFGGTNVLVSSLHQSWPWPYKQASQFDFIKPALEAMNNPHDIPVILAGDFNAAPWSYAVRKVEAATNTKHLSGIGPTWLTPQLPASWKQWLGLPLDQVLINTAVSLRNIKADIPSGSDHLPVLMEFSVPAPVSAPVEENQPQSQEPVKI